MGYTFFYKAGDKELNFCLLFNVLFSWCLWYRSSAPCHMQCSKRFGSKDSVPKHLSLRRSSGRGHIMPLKSFDIHITYIYWYRNSINSLRSWEAACTISMKYPLASFGPMGWGGGPWDGMDWGAGPSWLGDTQASVQRGRARLPLQAAALLPLLSGATAELAVNLQPHFKTSEFHSEGQRGETQGYVGTPAPPPHYCLGLWFPLHLSVTHKQ